MAATQLALYNAALRHCKERKLASLTENREPRRILDTVWDGDAIRSCLEAAQWKFALRGRGASYSPSVEPSFGFTHAFDKPTDFVRLAAISGDERFTVPLLEYSEEAGYWFADLDTIYVRYVSDDNAYGRDYSLWPASFTRYVEAYLAGEIVKTISGDERLWATVIGTRDDLLKMAMATDALAGPTKFPPRGSWVSARRSGRSSGYDGGGRSRLI